MSNLIKQWGSFALIEILVGALVTAAPYNAYGQVPTESGRIDPQAMPPVWGWPTAPWMPLWGYWYSPCYPFASCAAYQQFQLQERRRERFDELARQQQPSPQTRSGFPLHQGKLKISPDAEVQPGYLDSGKIRDRYQGSGDFLPEFLNGSSRPSR